MIKKIADDLSTQTQTNIANFSKSSIEEARLKQNKQIKSILNTSQICNQTCLIALVMSTCLCDSLLLLLLLLLLIIKLSELHQANLGQPRVLTLALQGSRSRPRFVRVEVGRCQRQQPEGGHDREEAAPAKPVLDCLNSVQGLLQ